jgi:OOP family OmpA-OmpF porin
VYFGFDCDIVAKATARALQGYFSDVPRGSAFAIDGHTDSIGTDQSNFGLSKRRAQAVAAALSNPVWTTEPNWFGERRPVAPNAKADGTDNPEGRMLNRRVEIRAMSDNKQQQAPPALTTFSAGPCPKETHRGH